MDGTGSTDSGQEKQAEEDEKGVHRPIIDETVPWTE